VTFACENLFWCVCVCVCVSLVHGAVAKQRWIYWIFCRGRSNPQRKTVGTQGRTAVHRRWFCGVRYFLKLMKIVWSEWRKVKSVCCDHEEAEWIWGHRDTMAEWYWEVCELSLLCFFSLGFCSYRHSFWNSIQCNPYTVRLSIIKCCN